MNKVAILTTALILATPVAAGSWWDKGKELLGGSSDETKASSSALSLTDISGGLKEALKVGSANVVSQLGSSGGFADDQAIRIGLPEQLQTARKYLDKVGMGDSLGDLENKMNQAVEQATPATKDLFFNAISEMNIDDAKAIYNGPKDSATQYFRDKMGGPLSDLIRPVVASNLNETGAVKSFDNIMGAYKDIPFVPDIKADLTDHTVNKGLDGIFHYLAQEEAAIRENPAKRTTELLQKVFSK